MARKNYERALRRAAERAAQQVNEQRMEAPVEPVSHVAGEPVAGSVPVPGLTGTTTAEVTIPQPAPAV